MDISRIARNIKKEEPGLWACRHLTPVSYPESGNLRYFAFEQGSFWFNHRSCCILELIHHFPPAGPIFDIGGGNGFVALAIQQAGFESVLVEPGSQGVANARARGLRTIIRSTFEDAGFKENVLPAAGLFDVIEHIPQDERFLKTVFHALAPGGRVYISAPAFNMLWSADDEYAGHQRRYSLSSLSQTLNRAGFRIDFATFIFSFLPLPIFFLRALPSRLHLRRGVNSDQERKEHEAPRGLPGRLLHLLLEGELRRLRNKRRILFGGSCLVVARAEK